MFTLKTNIATKAYKRVSYNMHITLKIQSSLQTQL